MQTINCGGAKFTPQLFIKLYAEARKLSPPRFMSLRIHPDRLKELDDFSSLPETIQMGFTTGPLGRSVLRVCCIRNPSSLGDGITVSSDPTCEPDRLYFDIHGNPELVAENIGYDSAA